MGSPLRFAVQSRVRDSRAGYVQSLEVLRTAKSCGVFTKSSLMLGLGEEDDEIVDAMLDLRDAGQCAVLVEVILKSLLPFQKDFLSSFI